MYENCQQEVTEQVGLQEQMKQCDSKFGQIIIKVLKVQNNRCDAYINVPISSECKKKIKKKNKI